MKFVFVPFGLLVMLCLFSACEGFFEEVVEVPTEDHVPVLSLNGILSDLDTDLQVYLTHTQGIFDGSPPEIIDKASVELYRNDILLGQFDFQEDIFPFNGVYQMQRDKPLGLNRDIYELRVSAPGYDPVFATQQMPEPVSLKQAEYLLDATFDEFGEQASEITFTFQDPPGDNFYAFEAAVLALIFTGQDTIFTENPIPLSSLDPSLERGNEEWLARDDRFEGEETTLTFFTDHRYTIEDPEEAIFKIRLRLISISEDHYRYSRAIQAAFSNQDNPFSEPIDIPSNVMGGEGVFSLEATSSLVIDL